MPHHMLRPGGHSTRGFKQRRCVDGRRPTNSCATHGSAAARISGTAATLPARSSEDSALMVKVRVDILAATGGEALSGGYTSASVSRRRRSEQGFRRRVAARAPARAHAHMRICHATRALDLDDEDENSSVRRLHSIQNTRGARGRILPQ